MSGTVDYGDYKAKRHRGASRSGLYRALGGLYRFLKVTLLYNTLLYPYGRWRHKRVHRTAPRSQAHTYTSFRRAPAQLDALTQAVVPFITRARPEGPVSVLIFACSNGAEPYTIAAALTQALPQLDFHIHASDLHREMVDKARAGRYSRDEVLDGEHVTPEFVAGLFDADGDGYVVKPAIKARVSFAEANLLDADLVKQFEPADIVFVQNVLFHLPVDMADAAFESVCRFLKPRSALFVDGMDLDRKAALTEAHGLEPLEFKHREIYAQSRAHIALAWWRQYYGCEPYMPLRRHRVRRYSTIFLRGR
jgi:chemotaxis protein methyltransferase CheR